MAQAVQGLTIRFPRLSRDSPYSPPDCPGTHCVAKASGSLQCSCLSLQSPVMAGADPFPSWTTVSFERLWCFPFWMDWALRETPRCVGRDQLDPPHSLDPRPALQELYWLQCPLQSGEHLTVCPPMPTATAMARFPNHGFNPLDCNSPRPPR